MKIQRRRRRGRGEKKEKGGRKNYELIMNSSLQQVNLVSSQATCKDGFLIACNSEQV